MGIKQYVLDAPLLDQTTYSGSVSEAGRYLCSAASLTMALQYFLKSENVNYVTIANGLMDEGYLDVRGLLSGDYLEKFVCKYHDKYPVNATYSYKVFDADYIAKHIGKGRLVIASVPNHYTLITGYRMTEDGSLDFHINDPYKKHWAKNDINAILRNDWVSAEELKSIWKGRHTVISSDYPPFFQLLLCLLRKIIRKIRRDV